MSFLTTSFFNPFMGSRRKLARILLRGIFLAALFCSTGCLALIKHRSRTGMSDPHDTFGYSEKKFLQSDMDRLLSSTTLFPIQDADLDRRDEFQERLSAAWTLTPLEVVSFSEFEQRRTASDRYSYFLIARDNITVNSVTYSGPGSVKETGRMTTQHSHTYLTLVTEEQLAGVTTQKHGTDGVLRKRAERFRAYSRIELQLEPKDYLDAIMQHPEQEPLAALYLGAKIGNWQLTRLCA
ncbi:MAG: hypothetical protein MK135_15450, partial [Polyangiaceae bacterium]|nr:hypothetical protein [Polyangiaceae bacterium]